ncbi:MAG: heme-binding domain-containing protein [Bdellovibrionales bacterium]|nr:heme-binding domain-containing protein [Bdellovibrionales bacterium]
MKIPVFVLAVFCSVGSFGHGHSHHKSESNGLPSAQPSLVDQVKSSYKEKVEPIFRNKCFDCHSNQTVYPWYYDVPGVKSFIDSDIKEAREHLDMSDGYPFSGHGNPVDDLKEIKEVIVKDEMPPLSYVVMHWNANLDLDERDKIVEWVSQSLLTLQK